LLYLLDRNPDEKQNAPNTESECVENNVLCNMHGISFWIG